MTRKEQIRAAAEQALKDCPYINTSLIGFDFFVKGAMWADETMIEWVCKWLDENLVTVDKDIIYNGLCTRKQLVDEYIKNFKEAIKSEV